MILTLNDLKNAAVSYTLRSESIPFENGLAGVSSGFPSVDAITAGWQKSNLALIASDSSAYKTDFAASMLLKMAVDMKIPIGYFVHEISVNKLATCIWANCCELDRDALNNGQLMPYEWEQFDYRGKMLSDLPVYFEEAPSLSIKEMFSKIYYLVRAHSVEILFVDSIDQIIVPYSMSDMPIDVLRSWRIKKMRQLAIKLQVPIIVMMTIEDIYSDDMTTKSRWERLAAYTDVACILKNAEKQDSLLQKPCKVLVDIWKNRNGRTGSTYLVYLPVYARFAELDTIE